MSMNWRCAAVRFFLATIAAHLLTASSQCFEIARPLHLTWADSISLLQVSRWQTRFGGNVPGIDHIESDNVDFVGCHEGRGCAGSLLQRQFPLEGKKSKKAVNGKRKGVEGDGNSNGDTDDDGDGNSNDDGEGDRGDGKAQPSGTSNTDRVVEAFVKRLIAAASATVLSTTTMATQASTTTLAASNDDYVTSARTNGTTATTTTMLPKNVVKVIVEVVQPTMMSTTTAAALVTTTIDPTIAEIDAAWGITTTGNGTVVDAGIAAAWGITTTGIQSAEASVNSAIDDAAVASDEAAWTGIMPTAATTWGIDGQTTTYNPQLWPRDT